MKLDPKTVAQEHGRNYGTLLVQAALSSAPENMTRAHANDYAEIIVNAIGDAAIRMRQNGLGAELGVIWFRAAVAGARERLLERGLSARRRRERHAQGRLP
jgi:hypothetical protein